MTTYFTGRPCPQGHVGQRYRSGRICVACTKERALSDKIPRERRILYKRRTRLKEMAIRPALVLVGKARRRARARGMEFSLTKEWAESTWTGRCELTGVAFEVGTGRPCDLSASIDRIDNSVGYVPENCRFILWALNHWKSAKSEADFQGAIRLAATAARNRLNETIGFCA